jgi:hypothetical protein
MRISAGATDPARALTWCVDSDQAIAKMVRERSRVAL